MYQWLDGTFAEDTPNDLQISALLLAEALTQRSTDKGTRTDMGGALGLPKKRPEQHHTAVAGTS